MSTLRIESELAVDSNLDPALVQLGISWQLLYATCAKLLNYPDKSGLAGSQLIPEVARSLPARSGDGKTYTFTIRPGFRFSPPSDEQVTAQTFRKTIERTLDPRMKNANAPEYRDIAGARAYIDGKAAHISGVVVRGDQLTIHLVAPAADFPARIAEPSMCAVPSDTPINPNGDPEDPVGRSLLRRRLCARPECRTRTQSSLPGQAATPNRPDRTERGKSME